MCMCEISSLKKVQKWKQYFLEVNFTRQLLIASISSFPFILSIFSFSFLVFSFTFSAWINKLAISKQRENNLVNDLQICPKEFKFLKKKNSSFMIMWKKMEYFTPFRNLTIKHELIKKKKFLFDQLMNSSLSGPNDEIKWAEMKRFIIRFNGPVQWAIINRVLFG